MFAIKKMGRGNERVHKKKCSKEIKLSQNKDITELSSLSNEGFLFHHAQINENAITTK